MEKSIESIWKDGFLASNALVAPRLNNLYGQKSQHLIDRFQRTFRRNLIGLLILSVVILLASFFVRLQYMGVPMFLLLNFLVLVNYRNGKGLAKIDKNVSSYQYLKDFSGWLETQKAFNRRLARFYYPYIFLAVALGFWMTDIDGARLGKLMVEKMLEVFPDMYLVLGVPLWGILGSVGVAVVLGAMGGKLYDWDAGTVYGPMFRKLDELIGDMEELRE